MRGIKVSLRISVPEWGQYFVPLPGGHTDERGVFALNLPRIEPNRMVRMADEGRVPIDVGIDRDRLEVRTLEHAQRLDGTDAAYRRFPAIEDGEPANGVTGTQWRPPRWVSDRCAKPGMEPRCE